MPLCPGIHTVFSVVFFRQPSALFDEDFPVFYCLLAALFRKIHPVGKTITVLYRARHQKWWVSIRQHSEENPIRKLRTPFSWRVHPQRLPKRYFICVWKSCMKTCLCWQVLDAVHYATISGFFTSLTEPTAAVLYLGNVKCKDQDISACG